MTPQIALGTFLFFLVSCAQNVNDRAEQAKTFIEQYDTNNDHKLSFEEFSKSSFALKKMNVNNLKEVERETFDSYDINHDGFIDQGEMTDVLSGKLKGE
jgi:Ca2+-binding EF-hand superfamily protein